MTITRRPLFWIVFFFLSIISLFFSIKHFSIAFPIVNLDLTINRSQALEKAKIIAQQYHLGPSNPSHAATFKVNETVKNYVELEAGGNKAFAQMIKDTYYAPYNWYVRLFKEHDKNESWIRLKPDGTVYGFWEELSEEEKGATLDQNAAQKIIEEAAPLWHINLSEYVLLTQSKMVRPSGRIDHTFIYERPDIQIGKAYYRIEFTVSGDKLTLVNPHIKIPEEFTRKYDEMRSANESLSKAASIAVKLLYLFGCCILALFFLVPRNAIIWRPAIMWALVIIVLYICAEINKLPLKWIDYSTAVSKQGFIFEWLARLLYDFFYYSIMYGITFIAAESLTRRAFGNQIQLWRSYIPSVASSYAVIGRTVAGYLLVPFFIAYVTAFYIFTAHYLGWWCPSDTLTDPNILAHYFPWLSPITRSLDAGFFEECLYRALPLSTAALIGQRLGNKRLWMIGAFILQIFIFGADHAHYAMQPAYARLIELILFSSVLGFIYLKFGLITSIITHFVYDVVWIGLPIFVSNASGILINQLFILIFALFPFIIILYGRLKMGTFHQLSAIFLNKGWHPSTPNHSHPILETEPIRVALHRHIKACMIVLAIVGLGLWIATIKYTQDALPLTITTNEAITVANQDLKKRNINLRPEWKPYVWVVSTYSKFEELVHRWIWQKGGKDLYHQFIGSYLKPPRIAVDYATYSLAIPLAERAEEYTFSITDSGKIYRLFHTLPEKNPGASLNENEARAIAHNALQHIFNIDPSSVKETAAKAEKMPARTDWVFDFENKAAYPLNEGKALITIVLSGNEISDAVQSIHVPETWTRSEENKQNLIDVFEMLCKIFLDLFIFFGLLILLKHALSISFLKQVLYYFIAFTSVYIIAMFNEWPRSIALFNTIEPFNNQLFKLLGSQGSHAFMYALGISVLLTGIMRWRMRYILHTHSPFLFGSCFGLFASGVYALIQKMAPSIRPAWAQYEAVDNVVPQLQVITSTIIEYILLTLMIMLLFIVIDFVTHHWQQKKWLGHLIFIISGIVFIGNQTIYHVIFWVIEGVCIGILLNLFYLILGRYDRQTIPIATAIFISSQLTQQIIFNAYPGAITGNILGIFVILLYAMYLANALRKTKVY